MTIWVFSYYEMGKQSTIWFPNLEAFLFPKNDIQMKHYEKNYNCTLDIFMLKSI